VSDNEVYVGIRDHGRRHVVVGYFKSTALPEGWRLTAEPKLDISGVMNALGADKELTLLLMNRHWQT